MRHWPVTTVLTVLIALILAVPAAAQQKPFTRDQVQGMVRDGLADETGARAIAQRGIDFAPAEDFIRSLKSAGASEAFLAALRAAKHPEPADGKRPINQIQVFALLAGQVPSHRIAMLVQERGIDFDPDDEYLREVRLAGGEDELVTSLKNARVATTPSVDPAAEARRNSIRQHAASGAEFARKRQYAEAEREYREALRVDPQSDDLYVNLAYVLTAQKRWDDAASAAREALRLNSNNDLAYVSLGVVLGEKGDLEGMIAEERGALRLNPNNGAAHFALGLALDRKGDGEGALGEYRTAYTIDPENASYKEKYESSLQKLSAPQVPQNPTASLQPPRPAAEILLSAKTLCIVQANGSPVIKAEIEKKLLKWGGLTLTSSAEGSDLLLVIAQTGQLNTMTGEGNQATASLKDRQSGAVLWSTTKGGSWSFRGWSNAWVGRAIADELTKFLTPPTKGGKN
jgi:tetratricopeptide (TPR) repeat protein